MGDLIGHLVPGIISTLFGYWWMYNVFYRYFYSKRFDTEYKNVSSFPCNSTCVLKRRWPVEAILKIVFSTIGIVGEVIMGMKHGRLVHLGNLHHVTMYVFFWLNGLSDLCLSKKTRELIPNIDYISLVLAFGVEAFLFSNHIHGKTAMNAQMHMFLIYIIFGCLICTLAEMVYPQSLIPALGRAFCTCFQGTWLIQIGFVLFLPTSEPWNQEDHEQMMLITLTYAWFLVANLIIYTGLGYLIWRRVQNVELPGASQQSTVVVVVVEPSPENSP